jgi:hypothetical protein
LHRFGAEQIAEVKLGNENEVTVQLTGTADAYPYVAIHYTGKKNDLTGDSPQVLINAVTGQVAYSADPCHKLAIKTAFPIA